MQQKPRVCLRKPESEQVRFRKTVNLVTELKLALFLEQNTQNFDYTLEMCVQ